MKRGQRRAHKRDLKRQTRVTEHEAWWALPEGYTSHTQAASDWRLRKVLCALANGARLTFDRVKGKWYCLAQKVKIHVKRGLILELLKCKFINFRLMLTGWGRYAAQATL